jgi:serine phosphatase RsbU (regulator of sigma subunit)
MASAISVLRRELSQEAPPEPHEVMRNLNSILSNDLISANCFITLVLAKYSPTTRQLVYANAGHIYPLVWSLGADDVIEPIYLKVRGVPLGILPNWTAPSGTLTLGSGKVLLLASDGITEATVPDETRAGAMLQQEGLWQLLHQAGSDLDLNQLVAGIQSHNTVQEDDQTILSLEVL